MSGLIERLFGKGVISRKREQPTVQPLSVLDQRLAEFEKQQEEQRGEAIAKAEDLEKIERLRRDAIGLDFQNEVINPAIKQWQETVPEDLIKLFDDFATEARTKFGGPSFTKKMLVKVNGTDFPSTSEKDNDDWERKEWILKDFRNPKSCGVEFIHLIPCSFTDVVPTVPDEPDETPHIINKVSIEPKLVYTRKLDLEQSFSISVENSKILCHFGNLSAGQRLYADTPDDRKEIVEIMVNALVTDLWQIENYTSFSRGYDPYDAEGGVT